MLASVVFLTDNAVTIAVALGSAVWLVALPMERMVREPTTSAPARYFNRISWYPEAVLLALLMGAALGGL